jgi:hypothetical protein
VIPLVVVALANKVPKLAIPSCTTFNSLFKLLERNTRCTPASEVTKIMEMMASAIDSSMML